MRAAAARPPKVRKPKSTHAPTWSLRSQNATAARYASISSGGTREARNSGAEWNEDGTSAKKTVRAASDRPSGLRKTGCGSASAATAATVAAATVLRAALHRTATAGKAVWRESGREGSKEKTAGKRAATRASQRTRPARPSAATPPRRPASESEPESLARRHPGRAPEKSTKEIASPQRNRIRTIKRTIAIANSKAARGICVG